MSCKWAKNANAHSGHIEGKKYQEYHEIEMAKVPFRFSFYFFQKCWDFFPSIFRADSLLVDFFFGGNSIKTPVRKELLCRLLLYLNVKYQSIEQTNWFVSDFCSSLIVVVLR